MGAGYSVSFKTEAVTNEAGLIDTVIQDGHTLNLTHCISINVNLVRIVLGGACVSFTYIEY